MTKTDEKKLLKNLPELEVKPCPFCGGTDLDKTISTEDREGVPVSVTCIECGAQGPWTYVKKNKLNDFNYIVNKTKWNDRV